MFEYILYNRSSHITRGRLRGALKSISCCTDVSGFLAGSKSGPALGISGVLRDPNLLLENQICLRAEPALHVAVRPFCFFFLLIETLLRVGCVDATQIPV